MTDDAKHIAELLVGRVIRDGRGLPRNEYLKEGAAEEKEARRALAKLLRNPSRRLDTGLRWALAELIDPDEDLNPRRIRFADRRKGRRSNSLADREIAEFIWSKRRAGEKTRNIIPEAEQEFGLKKSRVLAIWQKWQPILRRLNRADLKISKAGRLICLVQHKRD
jgi:hypothetical protein